MSDISNSTPTNLPTTRQLVRSTIVAAIIAIVILFAAVLPAEYGVDPTGIGSVLGLTEMGRTKVALAREVAVAESAPHQAPALTGVAPATTAPSPTASTPRSDVATIVLQPSQGREIKLAMREGARVTYSWSTDRGVVNYDKHADSKIPPRDYHEYQKGNNVATDQGELVAAFDGWHGWYWKNKGSEPLTVTLRTSGNYQDIKEPE
jgi:hypothetical protein